MYKRQFIKRIKGLGGKKRISFDDLIEAVGDEDIVAGLPKDILENLTRPLQGILFVVAGGILLAAAAFGLFTGAIGIFVTPGIIAVLGALAAYLSFQGSQALVDGNRGIQLFLKGFKPTNEFFAHIMNLDFQAVNSLVNSPYLNLQGAEFRDNQVLNYLFNIDGHTLLLLTFAIISISIGYSFVKNNLREEWLYAAASSLRPAAVASQKPNRIISWLRKFIRLPHNANLKFVPALEPLRALPYESPTPFGLALKPLVNDLPHYLAEIINILSKKRVFSSELPTGEIKAGLMRDRRRALSWYWPALNDLAKKKIDCLLYTSPSPRD